MIHFGVSYYPELLDSGEIGRDALLMQQAGLDLVRMGEFAWSRLEGDDGRFDFDWLEEAVETMARHGIKSLLGTPTAAPPKWLTDRYPDICQTMADGRRREFGKRRHYCVNSQTYHRHTERIVTRLAERFGNNPNVIGYQIDNEFMAEQPHCYCDACRRKFQDWLRNKFGTITELNRRWGTAFWSQQYRSFDEVDLPKPDHNPSAVQDLHHFFSDSFLEYAKLQVDCLKNISPDKPVTHNICSSGFVYLLDLYKLGAQLDIVSLDNYPYAFTIENEYGNSADQEYHPAMASLGLSMTRGLRRAPFWVTESQVGRTFRPRRGVPEPGIINAWTRQEIAHGAKAVVWFHWRQFPTGIEHLIQGVLECDGKPRRRYFEIQQTIRGIKAIEADIQDACPRPEVALLRDFHCDWALDDGHAHPDFRYQRHLYLYYRALFESHVNADVVHPAEDLSDYKLVLAPSLLLMDEARAGHLKRYVEQGGTLVLTVQTGLRCFDNAFHRQALPAFLTDLCGLEIEEQNGLKCQDTIGMAPVAAGFAKPRYECSLLFDIVKPTTCEVLFRYTDLWCAGTPAVTVNRFGKGRVYHVAAVPGPDFLREFLGWVLPQCAVAPNLAAGGTPMVESVRTFGCGGEYLHLVNFSRERQTVMLTGPYQNLADGAPACGEFNLAPYGAAILRKD